MFMSTIVWFRRDLRLADHSPLLAAYARGEPVLPVFIWDPAPGPWATGAASRVWLHHSLAALAQALEALGSRLLLRVGPPAQVLAALVRDSGATALMFNRRHEPAEQVLEARLAQTCLPPLDLRTFGDGLLLDPAEIRTGGGQPYRVFTPFWRRLRDVLRPGAPGAAPRALPSPRTWPSGVALETLSLLPRIPWDRGITAHWRIGEQAAQRRLARFMADGADDYLMQRDLPAVNGVSRLSPHLHFGEVSPRQIWHAVEATAAAHGLMTVPEPHLGWLRQIAWREFAQHLLVHYPATADAPLREDFADFPWRADAAGVARWQRGETGFPIVDAGMRELWHTGWMHNRVRMIVASFLTKDIGAHWLEGARWFWDTLVDADLPNNTLGWQWAAGCGADAAPYFRVFNPILQSTRFDPHGSYIRRWLPALSRLPTAALHAPWDAPPLTLAGAGVRLGRDYPEPMLDHGTARTAALARLKRAAP